MVVRPFQSALLSTPPPPPLLQDSTATTTTTPLETLEIDVDMAVSLLGVLLLMLLLLLLLFLLACRPWRFLFRSPSSSPLPSSSAANKDDIERPLFSDDLVYSVDSDFVEVSGSLTAGNGSSLRQHGLVNKKRAQSSDFPLYQGDSLVLDVVSETPEDVLVGQTLKRPTLSSRPIEGIKHFKRECTPDDVGFTSNNPTNRVHVVEDTASLRSSMTLEVIAGPSCGLCCSRQSTNASMLPLVLGRVSPSDLLLNDAEVSGKHARINWNMSSSKWELVDMGSLNGTLLNSQPIQHPDSGSRHWSNPVELKNGDIITFGTSSKVLVQIMQHVERQIPIGVGVASDPMALRRGAKKLPMEDMCYCQLPLPGLEQFGLFGIFDGHGGAEAAIAANKMLPENIANILSNPEKRDMVLSLCDASNVLKDAFHLTEAAMNHEYEGSTATVLLVWFDNKKDFFAQCANLGDSACFMIVGGKQVNMTEDHRVTSLSERNRLTKTANPLKDGESRICGLNLCRMLGDKFLKEQDARFSSEPYVSPVVHINKACSAFALLASDGLWDVMGIKKAAQLINQMKESHSAPSVDSAMRIADFLLNEARDLRTKDNTSIVFLDFDTIQMGSCITNS